jgi:DNA uptake protein ComE-like DNA-binding protein
LVRSLQERTICPYLAKAAYFYACLEMAKDETTYDTLYELKKKRKRELGRGKFIYTLVDEESKININKVSGEIIAALPGLDEDLAQKIIRLRNERGPIHIIEEVLLIEGITEEIFDKFKEIITIYTDGKVNINTASSEVMKALGLDDGLVNSIKEYRAGPDSEEGTEDDGIFRSVEEFMTFRDFSETQRSEILKVKDYITTDSKFFSLRIETEILNRPAIRYTIITDGEKIKRWIEQ